MREYKFRGYATEEMVDSQWLYGSGIHVVEYTEEYAIEKGIKEEYFLFTDSGWVQVEKESVGQYTGLMDENGREIFEGDILKFGYDHNNKEESDISPIAWYGDSEWQYPAFDLDGNYIKHHYFEGNILAEVIGTTMYYHEVVGNIYQNNELLDTE